MATAKAEDKSKKIYNRWYAGNKEAFNAARRARYKKDKEYREKALKNTRKYRQNGAETPLDGPMFREVDGKQVEVFRISTVGEKIGRSVQAIRQWEQSGIIPKPSFGRGHRVYTKKQVRLLKRVVTVSDNHRYNQAKYKTEIAKLKAIIAERWE